MLEKQEKLAHDKDMETDGWSTLHQHISSGGGLILWSPVHNSLFWNISLGQFKYL